MYRDLSHPIETGMPTHPDDPDVEVERATDADADGFAVSHLRLGSHAGTHVDAPSHVDPDGAAIDEGPVGAFALDARFVDVSGRKSRAAIRPSAFPVSVDADVLVVRTGWDDHWGTDRYLDHPFLTPQAAEHLRASDCGVAVDALSPDPTPTEHAIDGEPDGAQAHETLLGAGLPIVENLRNLAGLPERFTLYAFPLRIAGCDGSPVRAVAEFE